MRRYATDQSPKPNPHTGFYSLLGIERGLAPNEPNPYVSTTEGRFWITPETSLLREDDQKLWWRYVLIIVFTVFPMGAVMYYYLFPVPPEDNPWLNGEIFQVPEHVKAVLDSKKQGFVVQPSSKTVSDSKPAPANPPVPASSPEPGQSSQSQSWSHRLSKSKFAKKKKKSPIENLFEGALALASLVFGVG
jgi:hypothetical protein